jgi:hypothetical protein
VRVHYNLNHPESSSLEWTILIAHIETQTEGNKNNHVVKIIKKRDFFFLFRDQKFLHRRRSPHRCNKIIKK